ncbi:hypothetical protein RYX36_033807, partial [Vicia faba]
MELIEGKGMTILLHTITLRLLDLTFGYTCFLSINIGYLCCDDDEIKSQLEIFDDEKTHLELRYHVVMVKMNQVNFKYVLYLHLMYNKWIKKIAD